MKEFLLNLLSSALESVGESKLEEILQKLHDTHPDQYKGVIYGGQALVNGLLPLVSSTGTKIDDAFLSALSDAIRDSAAANGIDPNARVSIVERSEV